MSLFLGTVSMEPNIIKKNYYVVASAHETALDIFDVIKFI